MSDEPTTDKFEQFLQREARSYHAPLEEVPRDAMWAEIAKARAAARAASPLRTVGPSAGSAAASTTPTRPTLRFSPWVGMAATLLIGLAVGRFVWPDVRPDVRPQAELGAPVASAAGATGTTTDAAARPDRSQDAVGTGSPAAAATPAGATVATGTTDVRPSVAVVRTPAADDRNRSQPRAAGAIATASATASGNPGNATYRVASDQHLSRAEALVAVIAATPADAMMDSLTGKWARDILTNTRLLLDSPAGDDPVRRKLLEDLETVLVQLVQRSGRTDEDRAMLDRTLQRTQLLTRLRTGATGT